jgi:pilus assembly protein CpaE
LEQLGVVVAHDDSAIVEQVSEALESVPGLFVAATGSGAARAGHVLVAGGEALVTLREAAVPVVALAGAEPLRAARAALACGAADIVRWPEESDRLPGAIRRAGTRDPGVAPGRGKIVAVAGARGGVGATTVVAALAASFGDALVVDLDSTGAGQLGFATEESPGTIADLGSSIADLPGDALESLLAPHAAGRALYSKAGSVPLPVAAVHGLLRAARGVAPVAVLDLGRAAEPGTRAAALDADVRVLVVANDVASIRGSRTLREQCDLPWRPIVRRVRRSGIAIRDVAGALGAEPLAVVDESRALARACDVGTLPVRPTRAMRALARAAHLLREGWS